MLNQRRAHINVRGLKNEINDPNYRYTMEPVMLSTKKTFYVFDNIDSICETLNRERELLLKYLKTYFGTSFIYKNDTAMTTKPLTKETLQQAIYNFIDEFVLCRQCCNPETTLEVDKKRNVIMSCKACSYNGALIKS